MGRGRAEARRSRNSGSGARQAEGAPHDAGRRRAGAGGENRARRAGSAGRAQRQTREEGHLRPEASAEYRNLIPGGSVGAGEGGLPSPPAPRGIGTKPRPGCSPAIGFGSFSFFRPSQFPIIAGAAAEVNSRKRKKCDGRHFPGIHSSREPVLRRRYSSKEP